MVKLKWNGKLGKGEILSKKDDVKPFHILDLFPTISLDDKSKENWQNLLIWGENKTVINSLLNKFSNKISLIYIDPPFATGGNFNLKIQIGESGNFIDEIAYVDKWKKGLESYLSFLQERLVIMKELLNARGSIYVHLDWHISHYVKLIMDEIFGIDNFRNEIVWAYPAASARTRKFFIRSYDTILFYSKSEEYVFNNDPHIYMEYSNRVKNALKKDEHGIFYYRGGSHNGKKLSRKVYVEQEGIFPRDVWNDIPYIRANVNEYQGFSTQKPERLLKRIILASTNENDLVADFFCGSGTTLSVAEKLGRRWIGCDSNYHAIHMSRKRILDISSSNDILKWKQKYNKSPHSFQISVPNEIEDSDQVPSNLSLEITQNKNVVTVELTNYVIPKNKIAPKKINEEIKVFSDWIDYWTIDYFRKDQAFTNMWISYRTPKKRKLKLKSDPFLYEKAGAYNLSIKVIDIFGTQIIKSYQINI
ncbi:MAG: site-specific DNA-methyltransferase [Promethearchaeota archaeon]